MNWCRDKVEDGKYADQKYLENFSAIIDGVMNCNEFGLNLEAKLLHYTLGTPCFKDYTNTPMASEWHKERTLINYCEE